MFLLYQMHWEDPGVFVPEAGFMCSLPDGRVGMIIHKVSVQVWSEDRNRGDGENGGEENTATNY